MSVLEDLFRWRRVYLRFRDNPLGPVLERYVAYLAARGCTVETCRRYAWIAQHFGRWLGQRPLSQAMVRQFIHRHLPVCRCHAPVFRRANSNRAALNRLLEMTGAMAASPEFPPGFAGDLLRRYKERLVTVRGLAAGTVRKQLALTRIMLTNLQVQRAGQLVRWTPELIERYVSGEARRYQPSTGQNIACATRSFLRFILQEGLIRRDLSAAVPSFAHWRLGPLPKTLRKEELAQLIKAADVRTPMGLRNRAMFLCMTELGMRASDVAGLELNGVDLTARVLRLHRRTRM